MVVPNRVFEAEEVKKNCIVVGLQLNGEERELLSWALVNVAKEGDRLIAVHVSRNHQDTAINQTPSLLKTLDDFMADHEDICIKKQVVLAGRIARGNSIKRILVKEAEFCHAHTVIVGVSNNYSFGGSASLAKYCGKKLPSTVSLIAIHKGEIIFERAATNTKPISGEHHHKPNLRNFLHPSIGMDTKHIGHRPCHRLTGERKKISAMKESKDYCLILRDRAGKFPEPKPGWPLLRKDVAANIEAASKNVEDRKLSVVQWAMKLPNRSPASTPSQVDMVKELGTILGMNSATCKFFQYEELQISTNYFSSENLIGKGGNSQVYSGFLPNCEQVAVKVSKLSEKSSKDFLLEVDIITGIHHEGVMPLIGVCVEDSNVIAVYSYFPRGSLEENLHGQSSKSPLGWEKRFEVAVGVAEALNYLHYGCSRPVIHRDVKSSNILLTHDCKAKMGKSREGGISANWETSHVMVFCDLCIKEIELGNRPTTHFNKEGWTNLMKKFKEHTSLDYNRAQFKNKWDQLKRDWKLWRDLKRGETGLGWNPTKRTIDASDEWWKERLKMIPFAKKFRYCGIPPELEDKLDKMFSLVVATGDNVWLPTSGVMPSIFSETENISDDVDHNMDDVESHPYANDDVNSAAPTGSTYSVAGSKRKRKLNKKETSTKQVMVTHVEKLIANSDSMVQRASVSAIPPSVYLVPEALQELQKYPEIYEDRLLYDFATVYFLIPVNRVTFLNIPEERRADWLKTRYEHSLP